MTDFHNSSKIDSLLNALPSHVSRDVFDKITNIKNDRIKVCLFSNSHNLITDFQRTFFYNPVNCSDRRKLGTENGRLTEKTAGCYTATDASRMDYSSINEDAEFVIWLVDFDGDNENEEFNNTVRRSGRKVFTLLNYKHEDYKAVTAKKEEGVECPIKTKADNLKRKVIRQNTVFDICLDKGDGLDTFAKAFIKSYPNEREIFVFNTIKSYYLGNLESRVVGNYANFIAQEIKKHFNNSSSEKQTEINDLIKKHIGDEIAKGGIAFAADTAGSIISGIGSVIKFFFGK